MASKKFGINPDLNSISTAVEEIQATLNGWGCKREQVTPAVLTIEELLGTAVNVTGDGAITTIVAKSENKLDTNQYHSAS